MRPRLLTIAIFFAFLSLYLFSVGIPFYSSDAQIMFDTGHALAFRGRLNIEARPVPQIAEGSDGLSYSKYDLGMPLLSWLPILLGHHLGQYHNADYYAVSVIFAMLVPTIAAASAVTSLFNFTVLRYGIYRALMIAVVAGVGTIVWPYARLFFAETVIAASLTIAMLALFPYQKPPNIWFASLLLGIGILTRMSTLIYLPVFVFVAWKKYESQHNWLKISVFPLLAGLIFLFHNYIRFDNLLMTGYEGETFSQWPWVGAFGLLFSGGKSVFLYSPPLILSVILFPSFLRVYPLLAKTILVMTSVALIFFGAWWAWHGGWVWGARFLVPLVPLWILPWVMLPTRILWIMVAILIFLSGLSVQIVGTFTNVTPIYAEVFQGTSNHDDESRYAVVHYSPKKSPIVAAFQQAFDGQWEKQAIYELAGTDLPDTWVKGVPRAIHLIFGLSILIIGWEIIGNREDDYRKTEI